MVLRILGCILLGSLVCEAIAGTVKVAELTGTVVRKNDDSAIRLSSELNTGDRVLGLSSDASVLLECSGGATQMLTNSFDAIIDGTGEGTACAIDLRQGTAVATTSPNADQSTGATIKAGDVTLGALRTQFGASVAAEGAAAEALEAFVIEGDVAVSGLPEVKVLRTAQSVARGDTAIRPISEAKYEYLASSYAQLTTSRMAAAQPATEGLKAAYLRSFRNPADADARVALAARQKEIAPNSPMQRYQQSRAGALAAVVVSQGDIKVTAARLIPRHNGYRVDVCRVWGVECGQPAADAWCRTKDKQRARSYKIQEDIGASEPTVVMATGQLCKEAYCDAFSRIVCE